MTPEPATDEARLVREVLAGSRSAWGILYDRSAGPLERDLVWRCAARRDLAEDLFQEVWLVAVRRLGSFDAGKGTFADWLFGIAANLVRAGLRKRKPSAPIDGNDPPAASTASDPHSDPRSEVLMATLCELPEAWEAVLRLKYLDGRSVREIAALRGESEHAVESLLNRARSALRVRLEREESSDVRR